MPRIYARQRSYVTETTATRGTLCWHCQNATNSGCSWSRSFKPVEGWEATPTIINQGVRRQTGEHELTESFFVHKCPKFIEIPPKKPTPPPKKWYER